MFSPSHQGWSRPDFQQTCEKLVEGYLKPFIQVIEIKYISTSILFSTFHFEGEIKNIKVAFSK